MNNSNQTVGEREFGTTVKPIRATDPSLTWIDERMAYSWRCGDWTAQYTAAARWIVCPDESRTAFVVLATNGDNSWVGGDDTCYSARDVADAINRWSTEGAGLDACPEFIDALEHDLRQAEAKGTRLQVILANFRLEAVRARVAIARAEDAPPFTGYAQRQSFDDDDAETMTLVVPWEVGHDS